MNNTERLLDYIARNLNGGSGGSIDVDVTGNTAGLATGANVSALGGGCTLCTINTTLGVQQTTFNNTLKWLEFINYYTQYTADRLLTQYTTSTFTAGTTNYIEYGMTADHNTGINAITTVRAFSIAVEQLTGNSDFQIDVSAVYVDGLGVEMRVVPLTTLTPANPYILNSGNIMCDRIRLEWSNVVGGDVYVKVTRSNLPGDNDATATATGDTALCSICDNTDAVSAGNALQTTANGYLNDAGTGVATFAKSTSTNTSNTVSALSTTNSTLSTISTGVTNANTSLTTLTQRSGFTSASTGALGAAGFFEVSLSNTTINEVSWSMTSAPAATYTVQMFASNDNTVAFPVRWILIASITNATAPAVGSSPYHMSSLAVGYQYVRFYVSAIAAGTVTGTIAYKSRS